MTTSKDNWGETAGDGPTLEERRALIELLATDRTTLARSAADLGEDTLPHALQALAVELVATSIRQMELLDEIDTLKAGFKFLGALGTGLMFGDAMLEPANQPADNPDVEPEFTAACQRATQEGVAIRAGAGLTRLAAS